MSRPSTRTKRLIRPDRSRCRISVESLEGRALLSTYTWAGPVNGSYNNGAMWIGPGDTTGTVPGAGDDAVTPAGSYTITSSTTATVDSFTGGASLSVTGGTFTVTNANSGASSSIANLSLSSGATFAASGGTTSVGGGSIVGNVVAGGTLNLGGVTIGTGAALTGSGSYVITSDSTIAAIISAPTNLTLNASGTVLNGSAGVLIIGSGDHLQWLQGSVLSLGLDVLQGGTMMLAGAGAKALDSATLDNDGVIDLNGTGDLALTFTSGVLNQNAGVINITTDASITGGSTGTFTNEGSVLKSSTSNGTTTIGVPATLDSTSFTGVNSGTLAFSSDLVNNGEIFLDPAAVASVSGNYTQSSTGSLGVQVSGTPTTGLFGQLRVSGSTTLGGSLIVQDNTFNPTVGQVFPIVKALGDGTISGSFASSNLPSVGGDLYYGGSTTSTAYNLTAIPLAPATPVITGVASTDGVNANTATITQPYINGTATPGLAVQIYNQVPSPSLVAAGIVGSSGTFSFQLSKPLAYGNYTLKAISVDSKSQTSPATPAFTLNVLPPAPTGLAVATSQQGTTAGTTAFHQPTLTGQALPNIGVQVYDQTTSGPVEVGSGTSNSSGVFSFPTLAPLSVGTHTLEAIDVTGSVYGVAGAPYSLTITPPPPAPTNLAIYSADDDEGAGTTFLSQPRLSGQDLPKTTVQVYEKNGGKSILVAAGSTDPNGNFLLTPSTSFAPGQYTLQAIAVDAGGNYGTAGSLFTMTISAAPPAPTGLAVVPSQQGGASGTTAYHQPTLTGQAGVPNILVQVYEQTGTNPILVAQGNANTSGVFTLPTSPAFSPGTYTLEAIEVSVVNGKSTYGAAGSPFQLTITPPPAAPTGLTLYPVAGNTTSITQPQLTGKAGADLLVEVYENPGPDAVLVAQGYANSSGVFTLTTSKLAPGKYTLEAIAKDAGGNYGASGSPFTLTIT